METLKAVANRQSCRKYTGEQITANELQIIIKAANAAPVGMKKYEEVKLTVIQNSQLLNKLDAAGAALFREPDQHPLYGAPTVILVSAKIQQGLPNSISYCNAACIVENMALAATDLGLGNVYLYGVVAAMEKNSELCAELKVPKEFFPASAIAIGKAAEPFQERVLTDNNIATDYLR